MCTTISLDARRNRTSRGRGFTLVELLIVISIIGVLVALVTPAVQSARESGRRAQCENNLHQMALGCLALEASFQHLPGGGWGFMWAGDPDRGYGAKQPGGWLFNILPYIDQADLHDMGKGVSQPGETTNAQRMAQGRVQAQTPVSIFICPTRRKVQVYPRINTINFVNITDPRPLMARSDYAANSGSTYYQINPGSPNTNYDPNFDWSTVPGTTNSASEPSTGVIYRASEVSMAWVKDGASFTYMIGERYLCPDDYYSGLGCDDDQGWDMGYDWDINRGTGTGYVNYQSPSLPPPAGSGTPNPPLQDHAGYCGCFTMFGSSHPAGFHMAFCDGVVKKIGYDIDPKIHMQLGHRSDGEPTNLGALEPH